MWSNRVQIRKNQPTQIRTHCQSIKLCYIDAVVDKSKIVLQVQKVGCRQSIMVYQITEEGERSKKRYSMSSFLKKKQKPETTARGTGRLGGTVNQRKCETIHIHP